MEKRYLPTVLIFLCVAGVTSTAFADSNGPAAVTALSPAVNQLAVNLATVIQVRPLLDRIALGEGGTYDRINTYYEAYMSKPAVAGASLGSPLLSKPLTEMTIGEVEQLQQQMLDNPKIGSTAVGKYQILIDTLPDLVNRYGEKYGLSPDTKFDATTQDKLGKALLDDCGYSAWIKGTETDEVFQNNIAGKWASVEYDHTGKSHYKRNGDICGPDDHVGPKLTDCQPEGTTSEELKVAVGQIKSAAVAGVTNTGTQKVILTLKIHDGDINGVLLSDAQVTGVDATTGDNIFTGSTDSNGIVTISGNPGTWRLTISKVGYDTAIFDYEVTGTRAGDLPLDRSTPLVQPVQPTQPQTPGGLSDFRLVHQPAQQVRVQPIQSQGGVSPTQGSETALSVPGMSFGFSHLRPLNL